MSISSYFLPLLRPLLPYILLLPRPLLSLPLAIALHLNAHPSPSPTSFLFSPTSHPLHLPLALTLALIPLIYLLGLVSRNVSWVDRIWPFYPVVCSGLVVAWAWGNPAGQVYAHNIPRLACMLGLQVIWSLRLTSHATKRGFYDIRGEDYRYTQFRKLVPRWVFALVHIFVIAIAQPLLLFSLCLPLHAVLTLPPSELSSSTFSIPHSTLSHLLPNYTSASSSTPILTFADFALLISGLVIIAIEGVADHQMYTFQESKHALLQNKSSSVQLVHPPRSAGTKRDHLPQPAAYPASHHPGFPTKGLFKYTRHPNFAAEQLFWVNQALFVVSAESSGVTRAGWVGSVFGPCFALSLLFCASTTLTEWISGRKYPAYAAYKQIVGQFLPQETVFKWLYSTVRGERSALLKEVYQAPPSQQTASR